MSVLAKMDRLPRLVVKACLIYLVVVVALALFVLSFDFRLTMSFSGSEFIVSSGIDHGGNAIHYTGFIEGAKTLIDGVKNLWGL